MGNEVTALIPEEGNFLFLKIIFQSTKHLKWLILMLFYNMYKLQLCNKKRDKIMMMNSMQVKIWEKTVITYLRIYRKGKSTKRCLIISSLVVSAFWIFQSECFIQFPHLLLVPSISLSIIKCGEDYNLWNSYLYNQVPFPAPSANIFVRNLGFFNNLFTLFCTYTLNFSNTSKYLDS
jgi:hypothetical protein